MKVLVRGRRLYCNHGSLSIYKGKIAEREIFLKKQLNEAYADGKLEEVEKITKQQASERARLEEDREEEKERVRQEKK